MKNIKNLVNSVVNTIKGLSLAGQIATIGGTAVVAVGLVAGGVYAYKSFNTPSQEELAEEVVAEKDNLIGRDDPSDGLANNLANGGITEEEIQEKVASGEIDEEVAKEAIAKVEEIKKSSSSSDNNSSSSSDNNSGSNPSYSESSSSNSNSSSSSSNNTSSSSNSNSGSSSSSNTSSSKPAETPSKPAEKPAETPKPAEPAKPTVKNYSRPNWNPNMGNRDFKAVCIDVNYAPEVANKSTMSSFLGEMNTISKYIANGISLDYLKGQIVGTTFNGHKITNVTREKFVVASSLEEGEEYANLKATGAFSTPNGNFTAMICNYDDLSNDTSKMTFLKTVVYFE